jgi:hypothetical protein
MINAVWKYPLGESAYPFLEIHSFKSEGINDDGESNKFVVGGEFSGSECGQCIKKKFASGLKLANGYHVEATVDL